MLNEQLAIWNNTRFTYPGNEPLHALLEAQSLVFSGKEVVRYAGKGITYQTLNESANQLAGVLLAHGIRVGDTIGLSTSRSPAMIIALLAILKSGAAYIPLDPEYPQQRINYMLEDGGAKLLLASRKYAGRFSSPATELVLEDAIEKAKAHPKHNPGITVTGKDLAYIIYTSGSTGRPKGVMVEHGNLVNLLCSMQQVPVINQYDTLLAVTTISFDIAALELFLPLLAGAKLVITDTTVSRDGFALLELLRKEKISIMQATPVTWKIMLAAGWEEKADLKILCCGEPLPLDLATKLIPRCRSLYNYYGPTETTVYSTGTEILATDKTITIGGPIGNTQVYIVDENRQLLPPGKEGEIYIGGDGVSRGYRNMPELTDERFVADPFTNEKGKKMFRTGDLGKWTEEGKIYFMGRIDQQLKIRGYRIEPGEIEAGLLAQPGINDAQVMAREDTPDNKTLVAYIVPDTDHYEEFSVSHEPVERWKKALQTLMPDFMIPHEYVVLRQFPLLPNGKTDKGALPKPVKRLHEDTAVQTATGSATEQMIAQIWAEALGLDRVGLDEDFFELGGHSLIAVQIMSRLEKETGKRLPIAVLFESPTIKQLGRFLGSGNIAASWESLVPVKPYGSKVPLYIVHGDGLHVMVFNSMTKNMDLDQPVFGLQPRGMNGMDDPDESMEAIAAYYISEIRKHDPDGPYCLAGYSFGGIVAFEMARQLEKEGRELKLLAMFDTNLANIEPVESGSKRIWKKIRLQFPKMLFIGKSLFKHPGSMLAYQWFIAKRKWNSFLKKTGNATEDTVNEISQDEKKVVEVHEAAYHSYVPHLYSGRIDLFRVDKRVYFVNDPVFLGWKPFAAKGVVVHAVPGDHRTFLLPPNDKIFAGILQSVINERVSGQKT